MVVNAARRTALRLRERMERGVTASNPYSTVHEDPPSFIAGFLTDVHVSGPPGRSEPDVARFGPD
jgi:hypothetical protein